ncbi:MAG: hypothetical protein ACMUEM_04115 [Flavobacteriales bacterium AspAUS03]
MIKNHIIYTDFKESIPTVLHALARKNGIMNRKLITFSLLGALITIGFVGSVGLEEPAVNNGAR